jgi:hypothetical protein
MFNGTMSMNGGIAQICLGQNNLPNLIANA